MSGDYRTGVFFFLILCFYVFSLALRLRFAVPPYVPFFLSLSRGILRMRVQGGWRGGGVEFLSLQNELEWMIWLASWHWRRAKSDESLMNLTMMIVNDYDEQIRGGEGVHTSCT